LFCDPSWSCCYLASKGGELQEHSAGAKLSQVQDKAEKQAAKEAEKARKQAEKEEAAEARGVIKRIGDTIKASMVICKRGGMWEVPPGASGQMKRYVLIQHD
jgi:hypothetical protein